MQECCRLFYAAEKEYALASEKYITETAERIRNSSDVIDEGLYRAYADSLRKAVGKVFTDERKHIYGANVSRFAAYKAYQATKAVRDAEDMKHAVLAVRKFNSYQAAEYNTTVARCRTAKQWKAFEENTELFPNIRWLPSRSVTHREEHELFYNRVWPKDDPFWNTNQPGNLWNCKCDWEETDDPVTDGNPKMQVLHPGLEGNPGKTGEVFSDSASYIKRSGKEGKTNTSLFERDVMRKNNDVEFTAESPIGRVYFKKAYIHETAKMSIFKKHYFFQNEVAVHFDELFSKLEYKGEENVDLSHNSTKGKAYKFKKRLKCFHVFEGNIEGFTFVVKVGENVNDGKLTAYITYIKK